MPGLVRLVIDHRIKQRLLQKANVKAALRDRLARGLGAQARSCEGVPDRDAGERVLRQPYVPMALREVKTRVVTREQLDMGYVGGTSDGSGERREYVVLAYIVKDPDSD